MRKLQPYAIRRLTLADEPAMTSIIETTRREYGVQHRTHGLLEASDRDLYATYLEPRSDYFVAMRAGVVVGGAGIAPLSGAGEETCELQRMYLNATHRGKGVGQLLLNECLRRAVVLRFRNCYAETISEMKEAIRFYAANGFRHLSIPLGNNGHVHTDCWMILNLEVNGR